ncbi:MAG: F0F1 ATP synthase subunit delta [Hyphomicrobiales bacterium]|nr:F0F1 ATP synthase subunit delta [Hyphomicrobiales bacterium]
MASETPLVAGMAGRYATALFELAREEGKLDEVEKGLYEFAAALESSPDLQRLVRSPAFSADTQAKALSVIFKASQPGDMTQNFILLLAKNRRLFAIDSVIAGFRTLLSAHREEVSADVTSAAPLTPEQMNELAATLRNKLGKEAKINAKVDPRILGGLIVKIGSRMIDSSIKTRLNSLKIAMKEVG